jgi:hypothetical protein
MPRRVIAAGILGLGISAIAIVPSGMADEVADQLKLLSTKIDNLTGAFQKQNDRLEKQDDRLQKVEEEIRKFKSRPDTTTTIQPETKSRPIRVVVEMHRPHYPRYWCPPPPPWWGW